MNVILKQVKHEEKQILANLLEKFDYEFSQYDGRDVNSDGLYGYQYLDCYWTDEDRYAYFIMADEKLAGFAMIYNYREEGDPETDFQISEFFVMHKYRRLGVGRQAFFQVLDKHRGRCGLGCHPKNIPSVRFWNKVIGEHTKGRYETIKSKSPFPDGAYADMFYFNNG